jgi:hypothetical protein
MGQLFTFRRRSGEYYEYRSVAGNNLLRQDQPLQNPMKDRVVCPSCDGRPVAVKSCKVCDRDGWVYQPEAADAVYQGKAGRRFQVKRNGSSQLVRVLGAGRDRPWMPWNTPDRELQRVPDTHVHTACDGTGCSDCEGRGFKLAEDVDIGALTLEQMEWAYAQIPDSKLKASLAKERAAWIAASAALAAADKKAQIPDRTPEESPHPSSPPSGAVYMRVGRAEGHVVDWAAIPEVGGRVRCSPLGLTASAGWEEVEVGDLTRINGWTVHRDCHGRGCPGCQDRGFLTGEDDRSEDKTPLAEGPGPVETEGDRLEPCLPSMTITTLAPEVSAALKMDDKSFAAARRRAKGIPEPVQEEPKDPETGFLAGIVDRLQSGSQSGDRKPAINAIAKTITHYAPHNGPHPFSTIVKAAKSHHRHYERSIGELANVPKAMERIADASGGGVQRPAYMTCEKCDRVDVIKTLRHPNLQASRRYCPLCGGAQVEGGGPTLYAATVVREKVCRTCGKPGHASHRRCKRWDRTDPAKPRPCNGPMDFPNKSKL